MSYRYYKCPRCHTVSKDWEWDESTIEEFGKYSVPINKGVGVEGVNYFSPCCGSEEVATTVVEMRDCLE